MSIDPRLMERRKTVAEDNAKKNIGRLLKFLLIVVILGMAVWVVFSPWLSVKQVTAAGIETSSAHAVLAENRVRAGTPMILLDASEVESLLSADPWVADARVQLAWPDTVIVEVVERQPVAWVHTKGGWTRRAVDGVALPSEPEPDSDLAHIEMPQVPDEDALSSLELLGALEFVAALAADLHPGTVVTVADNELWANVSGYEVRLGRSDEMTEKALSLAALLKENIAEGSAINLMAPTNPASRAPNEEDMTDGDEAEDGGSEDETNDTTDQTNEDA